MISVSTQMIALAAASGFTPGSAGDRRPTMAAAVIGSLECASTATTKPQNCPVAQAPKLAGNDSQEHIVVPSGAKQCPDSGPGAACVVQAPATDAGNFAVPDGLPTCPVDPNKALPGAPGSCDTQPAATAPAAQAPVAAAPISSAGGGVHTPASSGPTSGDTLTLAASSTVMAGGGAMRLDAKSSVDVSGTPYSI